MFKVIIQRVATPKEANKRAIELSKQQLWQLMKTQHLLSKTYFFSYRQSNRIPYALQGSRTENCVCINSSLTLGQCL